MRCLCLSNVGPRPFILPKDEQALTCRYPPISMQRLCICLSQYPDEAKQSFKILTKGNEWHSLLAGCRMPRGSVAKSGCAASTRPVAKSECGALENQPTIKIQKGYNSSSVSPTMTQHISFVSLCIIKIRQQRAEYEMDTRSCLNSYVL
jgi:hypothetical protein